MVASDCEDAGVLDDSPVINNVFSRPAPDIYDERAHLLLFIAQQGERRGEAIENNCFDFNVHSFDGTNRILEAVEISVDNMHVHFHTGTKHAHRINDAIVAIHEKMLADGVQYVI